MDWLALLKTAGPLVTLVIAVGLAAWRMLNAKDKIIEAKDAEIARINDLRVKEQQAGTDRLLGIVQEFNALTSEANETLKVLADRMQDRRSGPYR